MCIRDSQNEVVAVLLDVGLELAKGVVGEECAFQFVKVVERIEIDVYKRQVLSVCKGSQLESEAVVTKVTFRTL